MENEAALEIQQIKICVENLPPASTEKEVAQLFEKYGKVYAVAVKNSPKAKCRFSIVEIQPSAGIEAIQALDGYIYDNHKLRVHKVARILLLDDAEIGQIIGDLLEKVGYQHCFVNTGQKARELLEKTSFDLFIMDDVLVPDIDTWEMYTWIKTKEELREMGIIITTPRISRLDTSAIDRFDKRDIPYYPKPYDIGHFLSSIEKVLRAYEKSHLIIPR